MIGDRKYNVDIQYIGQRLLERGFKDWFLFFFKQVEGVPFVVDEIHDDLFNFYQDIFDNRIKRGIINIPPRAGKTTMAIYFIAFCYAYNKKCNFIYTGYSQELLADNSRVLCSILEHPIYKSMYAFNSTIEEQEEQPIDDFWAEYLKQEIKKNTYTARKITIAGGGITLFASIGSSITGFGAGVRNSKKFSGCLIVDDPNKPIEVHSQRMREKVMTYFEETLLSRLNSSEVPILIIQQRLHTEDLTGQVLNKYDTYRVLTKPLLNEDRSCNIESQYTAERLKEIQTNNYLFSSQYQQQPIKLGGNLIKGEWFNYYEVLPKLTSIDIYADTALTDKKTSDYTVMQMWGRVGDRVSGCQYYLIDQIRGKWQADELLERARAFYMKANTITHGVRCRSFNIEQKVNGIVLLQQLRARGIPVGELKADKDKVLRVNNALPTIASGLVFLPSNASWLNDFLSECETFPNGEHDDQVDPLAYCINDNETRTVWAL
ncbi:MAG: phage terminase large subunit [Endomicrobium sp.]|jgi:predicted phage terminase large subunit-like protein|nr:phage terminase large subunit [Endomicrobium sp.]